MESSIFFNLNWNDAQKALDKMKRDEMKAIISFAFGYIQQASKITKR